MEVPQLWVKASFPLNVQEIVNVTSYKLMALMMQEAGGSDHVSGVSKFF